MSVALSLQVFIFSYCGVILASAAKTGPQANKPIRPKVSIFFMGVFVGLVFGGSSKDRFQGQSTTRRLSEATISAINNAGVSHIFIVHRNTH
jgi:hypothetical protein